MVHEIQRRRRIVDAQWGVVFSIAVPGSIQGLQASVWRFLPTVGLVTGLPKLRPSSLTTTV